MKIHCLSITNYRNCPITILHLNHSFIYLFVYKGKFYFDEAIVKPDLLHWAKWRLGLTELPYKPDNFTKIRQSVLTSATNSIDVLLDKK